MPTIPLYHLTLSRTFHYPFTPGAAEKCTTKEFKEKIFKLVNSTRKEEERDAGVRYFSSDSSLFYSILVYSILV